MVIFTQKKLNVYTASQSYTRQPSVITIGTFDGVHMGHQKIIKRLQKAAETKGLQSVVLTFFPHPRMVLQGKNNLKLLNTIDERCEILAKTGLQHLVIEPFTNTFANLSAQAYVKQILVDNLNAKHIIIGYDHRFGKNRSANIEDLKRFGKKYNFEVEEISAQDIEDVTVSSTKIRQALEQGDITTANNYLAAPYFLTGTVVKGNRIGTDLGFPTANINIAEAYKLIPKQGVYVVEASIDNNTFYGMMNIGVNPTVNGKKQTIEVHLFNFNKDIYKQPIKVAFLTRLRDEFKFNSVSSLQAQLKKDQENALRFITNLK